jgi:hypothetical protein
MTAHVLDDMPAWLDRRHAHHRRTASDPARAEDLYRSHMSAAQRLCELAHKLEGWG